MTDPRIAALPGERPPDGPVDGAAGESPGGADVATRIQSAGQEIAGVSEAPLAEAVVRLDTLHRELHGALADLDQA